MTDTLITFVRHGENYPGVDPTAWHLGPGLNPAGKKQAERTGRYLRHFVFDAVLSSDMARAAETAGIICRYQKKITPKKIIFARELAEHDEIVYGYTHKKKINRGGEWAKARATVKFFQEILQKYRGQRVLLSAHGNVIRACVGAALGFPLHYSPEINSFNCSLTTIAFRRGRLRAIFHINQCEHLGVFPFLDRLKQVKFISDYSKLVDGGADGQKK
ncbi:MAG TPA: histidine phosphatase family protein, partial [Candidatus Methylomirabilis sp.]|nr:histidine phosphatase family protein [Candidatus Methylomirabilis sp.]